ncbi:TetR family transcriptional regulator [Clostridium zeae]|uniref:TetR family transcriptional regulator n=1 Tax=Clostridium zeae TaxID=2759022 RepID=A0ABQ1EES7_9CLOT|nr:TetR/AcrR family transcriptional regulator [Clostridium zeae]GFZ33290.1 TetR family transcriptional regulator [Clostridium zeae]
MRDKKADILVSGRDLFSSKGFKDTNVSDITKMAGIGVGTFYNYYASKEKLFLELFLEENAKLKRSIMETVDLNDEPLKLIKQLMLLNINGMNSNPILSEWYNRDVFDKVELLYREENGNNNVDFIYGSFSEIIKKWQAEGKMRDDIDCDLIMAFFISLINMDTHKEEIGIQHFPHILDYLADFILKGLTDYKK